MKEKKKHTSVALVVIVLAVFISMLSLIHISEPTRH